MASEKLENATREWTDKKREVDFFTKKLNEARLAERLAADELAMLIVPNNMALDECICVWVRTGHNEEKLLQVTKRSRNKDGMITKFEVLFRGEPRDCE